jgi:flavoprotein hydroxylase
VPSEVPGRPGLAGGLLHATAPHAGRLFVQGEVGGRPFDDVHGAGWRLVTVDGAAFELDPEVATWFDAVGGRVVAVGDDLSYERWCAEHEATWALQRPDFHLYGSATGAAGAADLVRDLRRHLAGDLEGARS